MKQTLIYWREIPSQIVIQKGRSRVKQLLSTRFQEAVDRAAMRAGKGSSDAYISEWRRDINAVTADDDPADLVRRIAARIESEYSDERLLRLVRSKGYHKDESTCTD